MACPTFENLIDFADETAAPAVRTAVGEHLATRCADCESALAWYRSATETAAADRAFDPPAWVTRRALDLFADARARADRKGVKGLLARLRGALVFDSAGGRALDSVPARGGAATESRQLLYSAAAYDVDMLVAGREGAGDVSITGQVLGGEGAADAAFASVGGMTVELRDGDESVARAETSEFGEFAFDAVRPGTYDVQLAGERCEIVIERAPIRLD